MSETITQYFTEQGLLGVLVLLLLGVVIYLFKILMEGHKKSLEDKSEVVRALTQNAASNEKIASSVQKTNELITVLLSKESR